MNRRQATGVTGYNFEKCKFVPLFFGNFLNALCLIFRYGKEGCSYIYKIDAHTNDMSRMVEGQAHYFIDSTKYGNVSRFINHR